MGEFNGRIGHLYGIESPWGNAGGVIKTLEQVATIAVTRVGWIETGSYTPETRPDLALIGHTTYIHDTTTGATFNKFEMPNQGFGAYMADVPEMLEVAHAHRKPLIANFAPTGDDPIKDTVEMVREAYDEHVDAVLINPDCPSIASSEGTIRQRLSTDPKWLEDMLTGLREQGPSFRPVFLRVAPAQTLADMNTTMDVVRSSGIVSAVFVSNSWAISDAERRQDPRLNEWGNAGGKSGPAMAFRSANQTRWAVQALQGTGIDVVRSSGVADANELRRSLDIGAVAAAGTTFFMESQNGWNDDVDQILAKAGF